MHPSLDVEGRYDSMVGVDFGDQEGPVGDFVLRIRPGFSLEIPSPTLNFSLDAAADWNRYSDLTERGTQVLSYVGGDAHLGFHVNPASRVSMKLGDRFTHSDRTSAVALGVGVLSIFNDLYVKAPMQPGGGALTLEPAYSFVLESFLTTSPSVVFSEDAGQLNYFSHRPSLDVSWRFLPKTALVLEVSGDIRRYPDSAFNVPVNALQAMAGVSGLVTPRVSVLLRGGYGNSFIAASHEDEGLPNFEGFIGQLDATFTMSETARLKAGLVRTFFPVPGLGWYNDNRFYTGGALLMGGRFLVEFDGAVHMLDYATGRRDFLVQPSLSTGLRLTRWLSLAAGYRHSLRWSEDGGEDPATNFHRNEVFGSLRMSY